MFQAQPMLHSPFHIICQVNLGMYRLLLPPLYRTSPTFHVSLLKAACPHQDDPPTSSKPPLPLNIDEVLAYLNTFLDSCHHQNRQQYLVDWEGCGPKECSWIDANDILDPSLVGEFHRLHPN